MSTKVELSDAKRALLQKKLAGRQASPDTDRVVPRPQGTAAPMSPEQTNVRIHAAMSPAQPIYNEPVTIHRKGRFDRELMERSFNTFLARHEVWRSEFAEIGGEVVQVVRDDLHVALPVTDLTDLPVEQREQEALRLAAADARLPLDLAKAPLFRILTVKLAEDDHRLFLTLHHAIFDGVSLYDVLVPELAAIYAAFEAGTQPRLPVPALQYGDYAIWRRRRIDSGALDSQADYWRKTLAGDLPALQLPTDRPRPAEISYRGAMELFALGPELDAKIKSLSRSEGVTPYMTLLAGFNVLLHRYSGQDDIIVGGVTDTRRRPELKNMPGYFLTSMPLRTKPQGTTRFRDFLHQTRETVLGALGASEVPFDRIVREANVKGDPSRHPLFQVLFSIQPPAPQFGGGWDLTQMDVTAGGSKFDLYLELEDRPDGMIGRFLYNTDLFDVGTIRAMIGHWRTLLDDAASHPDTTLAQLTLLTDAERQTLLVDWNATQRDVPATTLHEWFEAQARETPDDVAIECGGDAWTYRELDEHASKLAARLRFEGVGPETLVAIAVDRSLAMVSSLLAIFKAGGAYLPLDPALPPHRLALILDDAKPAILLTRQSIAAMLPKNSARLIFCDDVTDIDAVAFQSNAGPDNLAYVLYTSGSTGKPKGVEITHRALVNLLAAMRERPGFGASDSLLAVTTLSFDIAGLELFLPLVSGGRVILATSETAGDPVRLLAQMNAAHPTMMQATPATWRGLLDAGWTDSAGMTILCGGEALPRELADRLLSRCAALWNVYGPTETTIWSTAAKVEAGTTPVPIGQPIANTTIFILDGNGNPVPPGVPGELFIGGSGLARGYRNRPDLTAERFIECDVAPGQLLYRTGDLARYRADGAIECLGRNDNQVKIRGFRVATEEIEAALALHPKIAAAAIKARPDASGEFSLAAYIVARESPPPGAAELRRFLRQTLPDYMIPSRYVRLDALPMTPNRKVDRNALPHAEVQIEPSIGATPESEHEIRLAKIWKDVLGVASVGQHDNFHDLGGHSLLITKLLARIEAEFSHRLPMAAVFNAPTLMRMAALLGEPAATRPPRLINIQPNGNRPPIYWLFGGPTVRPLAEAMGQDQPFFGIALDLDEQRELSLDSTFADIAAYFVRAIREAQPRGPYYLGGWCTAGILGYEVAQQLTREGEEVGLLALVHATNPVHYVRMGDRRRRWSKLKHHGKTLLRLKGRARWRFIADKFATVGDRVAEFFRVPPTTGEAIALNKILDHAGIRYQPKPYGGDVALFQPADRPDALDYRPGWREVVRGAFASFEIDGTHSTMLEEPYVGELAARMSACLRRAQMQNRGQAPRRAAG